MRHFRNGSDFEFGHPEVVAQLTEKNSQDVVDAYYDAVTIFSKAISRLLLVVEEPSNREDVKAAIHHIIAGTVVLTYSEANFSFEGTEVSVDGPIDE